MTDVRLTATTPEGDVVPVLSNTKGELLLEEPIAPEFDGNLDGDLSVSGSAGIAGATTVGLPGAQTVNLRPGITGTGDTLWLQNSDNSRPFLIGADGSAQFSGGAIELSGSGTVAVRNYYNTSVDSSFPCFAGRNYSGSTTSRIFSDGSADFTGDVVIGSRGKQWLIRESNGVAMLIEQGVRSTKPRRDLETVKVRDLPNELDLIEAALNEVMDKLRMTPPAGWEVWDGSDNSR